MSSGLDRSKRGLVLPTRESVLEDSGTTDVLRLAALSEELGYDSVWVGDSLTARPRLDPFVTLAGVACATKNVKVGTAVLLAAHRHPVHLAQASATLDLLSGGRVILGVGAGPSYGPARKEFALLGIPFERRLGRLRETMRVCRQLWGAEPVNYDGEFFSLSNATVGPRPAQSGGPPIWWGGSGPQSLAMAPEWDGWFPGGRSPHLYAESLGAVRESSRRVRPSGRIVGAIYLSLSVADNDAEFSAAQQGFERYYQQPFDVLERVQDMFIGPAELAAEWIDGYARAGAEHVVLRFAGPRPERQIRALAGFTP